MKLNEMQTLFLVYVDDSDQDKWTDIKMNTLLWKALDSMVGLIEKVEPTYFTGSKTFTHTASTTVIDLSSVLTIDKFRRVVLLEKLDGIGLGTNIPIIHMNRKNDPEYLDTLCVFFNGRNLEFRKPPNEAQALKMYFTEDFSLTEMLAFTTTSEFVYVPARFHGTIALKAAVRALTTENTSGTNFDPLKSELIDEMRDLENLATDRQLAEPEYGRDE